jgi:hypothetical protein
MAVTWVNRNINKIVLKRALERWETKLANCAVTPETICPIAKFLTNRGAPKALSAIRGPLGPIFCAVNKANIIANCLENQFRVHDLCDCDHRRLVEAQVEALPPMKTSR